MEHFYPRFPSSSLSLQKDSLAPAKRVSFESIKTLVLGPPPNTIRATNARPTNMTSLRTIAEGFMMALEDDFVRAEEVASWADKTIAELDYPISRLTELTRAGNNVEMTRALAALPGKLDIAEAHRRLYGHMRNALLKYACNLDLIAYRLSEIAYQGNSPNEELEDTMIFFASDLEFANTGRFGTRQEIRKRIEDFLTTHGRQT